MLIVYCDMVMAMMMRKIMRTMCLGMMGKEETKKEVSSNNQVGTYQGPDAVIDILLVKRDDGVLGRQIPKLL